MTKLYRYTVVLEPDLEDGGYVVTVPDLPGCITQGDTLDEAIAMAKEAISLHIESLIALGKPVPQGHDLKAAPQASAHRKEVTIDVAA
jgi:antitoxin HicB